MVTHNLDLAKEYSTRTVVHFDQTYTLANGDIYYSTGALSKKLIDHTTYGTPVGLVFSTLQRGKMKL